MKVLFIFFVVTIALAWAQTPENRFRYNGRYYDDSGQYRPDYSGAYAGNEGQYIPDNSGAYVPDDSGAYRGTYEKYIHQEGRFGNGGGGDGGFGSSGGPKSGTGSAGLRKGSAAGLYEKRNYAIIRKVENVQPDGYHYLYETENKIFGEEQGKLANKGTKEEVMRATGYFEYTGPDSVIYRVDYSANENGFLPVAVHIPTPPPIPKAILRALEYQKSLGEL